METNLADVLGLIRQAEAHRDNGRTGPARALYGQVLALIPDEEFATLGLGVCERRDGNSAAALEFHRRAQAAHPQSIWPHVEAAEDLFILGRLDEAEAAWRATLTINAGEPNAQRGLVRVARARNDAVGALAAIEAVAAPSAGLVLDQAALLAELRREPEALAVLAAGDAAFADNPLFLVETARLLRLGGDLRGACLALEQAALRDAGNPLALLRLSDLARQVHDLQLALRYLDRASQACRPDPWIDLCSAQVMFELGRYADSAARLQQAARNHAGNWLIALVGAELLARRGLIGQAQEIIAQARRGHPGEAALLLLEADLATRSGQPAQAAALLAAVTAGDAMTAAAQLVQQGGLAEDGWRRVEAAACYAAAAVAQPGHRGALSAQVRLALLAADLPAARQTLVQFARLEMPDRMARGLPASVSQSFFGQLVEEYAFEPAALQAMGAALGRPMARRLRELRALARDYPDWTPAAIALLLSLREAGLFDAGAGGGAAGGGGTAEGPAEGEAEDAAAIPRRISQYWHDAAVPADIADLVQSWRARHPGWVHEMFDDGKAVRWFLARAPHVLAAYLRAPHAAQKSDILRLAVLAVEGGWYVDADDRCLGPLADLAAAPVGLVAYQEEYATLGNNLLGARPGHPVIVQALENAVTAVSRGDSDSIWLATGPGMLTRSFVQVMPEKRAGWPAFLQDVTILSKPAMRRASAPHCHAAYKFVGSHWTDAA